MSSGAWQPTGIEHQTRPNVPAPDLVSGRVGGASTRGDAELRDRRGMGSLERHAINHHGDVAGFVGERARLRTVVQRVAELLEHAARRSIQRRDGRIDAVEPELGKGERVDHKREPRTKAFALLVAGGDHERELRGTVANAAQVGIADECPAKVKQERPSTSLEHRLVVNDDLLLGEGLDMTHQPRILGFVVPGRQLGGMLDNVDESRLDCNELADVCRPLDSEPGSGRHAPEA